jgi:hypothetical protein
MNIQGRRYYHIAKETIWQWRGSNVVAGATPAQSRCGPGRGPGCGLRGGRRKRNFAFLTIFYFSQFPQFSVFRRFSQFFTLKLLEQKILRNDG